MSGFSNFLEEKVLGYTFCRSSFTIPATFYVALCTSITSDGDSATEVTTNVGYAHQPVWWTAPVNPGGTITSSPTVTFGAATTPWPISVTWVAIVDSVTIGSRNVWAYGLLDVARTVSTNDSLSFTSGGNLTIQLA